MYKIFIKYTSTFNKIFWQSYMIEQEDGAFVEFETDNVEVLKEEVNKLDKIHGNENLRIVADVTYTVTIGIPDDAINIASSEDISDIYNTAYTNVFGGS